jgi:hypothetical protein
MTIMANSAGTSIIAYIAGPRRSIPWPRSPP